MCKILCTFHHLYTHFPQVSILGHAEYEKVTYSTVLQDIYAHTAIKPLRLSSLA